MDISVLPLRNFAVFARSAVEPLPFGACKGFLRSPPDMRPEFLATFFLASYALAFPFVPASREAKMMAIYLAFLLLLPFIFVFSLKNRFDARIGDLSYPLYICHMLVNYILVFAFRKAGMETGFVMQFLAVVGALAFSWPLLRLIVDPVEILRSRIRKSY